MTGLGSSNPLRSQRAVSWALGTALLFSIYLSSAALAGDASGAAVSLKAVKARRSQAKLKVEPDSVPSYLPVPFHGLAALAESIPEIRCGPFSGGDNTGSF
jgi:hypothetical protein